MEGWKAAALLAAALIIGLWLWKTRKKREYQRSEYRAETRKRYKKVESSTGTEGEYETSLALEKRVRGKRRFVFNAYIPCRSGASTETDIVMIHEKGIFVIENKNYYGRVKGRADREYWEQIVSGRRKWFYSPIYQNQGHIRHLRRLLEEEGCRRLPMVSVVVFNDRLKRLQVRKKGRDVIVCKSRRAAGKINRRLRHMEKVLDDEQLEKIYELLKEQTRPFWWVRRGQKKRAARLQKQSQKFVKKS